ncbi:uncharacterized protein [Argopecten irradians]|uniref:uncharacterized protein n=1 Tax=Argopecten irradians TaxID=31199 RepID=UPI00370FB9DE
MMQSILVFCVLAICISATCVQGIGEKIYLKMGNGLYAPLRVREKTFGQVTRTPDAGSFIIGIERFRLGLQQYVSQMQSQAAHRHFPSVMSEPQLSNPQVNGANMNYMSPFENDGQSSAYFEKRGEMQNHPVNNPTQTDLGSKGFYNPKDPFTGKIYQ